MKHLQDFLKQLMTSLGCLMIALSLSLYTYPQSTAYAADSDDTFAAPVDNQTDCEEDTTNSEGEAGVYKPGCEFNEDLAKTDLKSHYPEGIVGIVEQFIGAAFALIGVTLISNPIPSAVLECPQNQGTKVTFPVVMAGSLSYLIGEIAANVQFKKASEVEVNKTFAAKQDENVEDKELKEKLKEQNQKQMEAFFTLANIYEQQSKGLKTKTALAGVAQAAFITAEVLEITNAAQATAQGNTIMNERLAKDKFLQGELGLIASSLTINCPVFAGSITSYLGTLGAYDTAKMSKGLADASTRIAVGSKDAGNTIKNFVTFAFPDPVIPVTHDAELLTNATNGGANDATAVGAKSSRAAVLTQLSAFAKACPTTECSYKFPAPPAAAACATAATPIVVSAEAAIVSVESFRALPITCTGGDTLILPSYENALPAMSAMLYKPDHTDLTRFAYNENFKSERNQFYLKKIISNFFHRIAWNRIESQQFSSHIEKLNAIAVTTKYAEYMAEQTMEYIKNPDFEKEVLRVDSELQDTDLLAKKGIYNTLGKFNFEVIESANAGGVWSELLMMGVKVLGLYFILGKKLKNNAFPKPKTRMITWGIMAAVNAAIIIFDSKTLRETQRRKELVLAEAEKFARSHGLKQETEIGAGEGSNPPPTGGSNNPLVTDNPPVACAVANSGGFAPAACPSVIPTSAVNVPRPPSITGIDGSLIDNALDLISDTTRIAATGGALSGSEALSGNLASLGSMNAALRNKRDKLRKKMDTLEKKTNKYLEKKTGKKAKSPSLLSIHSQMKKQFTGDPGQTGVTSNMLLANDSESKDKKEDKKTTKPRVAVMPDFKMPSAGSTPNFDFGLDDEAGGTEVNDEKAEAGGEQDLAEFQLNENDIIDKPGVNIFQVISNRYLRSYPILLEEK